MQKIYNKILTILKKPQIGFLAAGVVLLIVWWYGPALPKNIYETTIVTSFYAIAGIGFALLMGYAGLSSLGTGAFFGIGAFGFHYLYKYLNQSILVAVFVVIILSIIVSLIFGIISLRIAGMYLAIITMGLSRLIIEIVRTFKPYADGSTGGFLTGENKRELAFLGMKLQTDDTLIFIAIFLVIGMIIVYNLINSSTGRALLAIKNSKTAAQTMGIKVINYRLLAFVISGIYGTVAGVCSILYTRNGDVGNMDLTFALNILAAVIVGGSRSIWGILLGSFVIFGMNLSILPMLKLESFSIVLNGVLIILIMMFYPNGLINIFTDLKGKILKLRKKIKVARYGEE